MSVKVNPQEIRSVQVLTPRLQKLKAEWEAAEPQVYVDDTLLFTESWKETEISKHIEFYLNQGIDKKEAFKLVAKDRGISKRDVYSYYEENMK